MPSKTPPKVTRKTAVGDWICEEEDGEQFVRDLNAADRGDIVAQKSVKSALSTNPSRWRVLEDVADLTRAWATACLPDSWLTTQTLIHAVDVKRDDLLGDAPMDLERLVIERICLCWLALRTVEERYLRALTKGESVKATDFYDRHLNAASRRYLAAIKSLAEIRKLQLPTVGQLNIGAQQLNVAAQIAKTRGEELGTKKQGGRLADCSAAELTSP